MARSRRSRTHPKAPDGAAVGGSGGGPNTTCGQAAGPSKVYNGSLTTSAPAAWLGAAIGGFAGGYYGAAFGAIIGSTFGIGVGGSYVPSTHSLYLGPTAVFSPFGGGGGSINSVNVPSTQNPNSIANGLSYTLAL